MLGRPPGGADVFLPDLSILMLRPHAPALCRNMCMLALASGAASGHADGEHC